MDFVVVITTFIYSLFSLNREDIEDNYPPRAHRLEHNINF